MDADAEFGAIADDDVLRVLVTLMIRRRAAGFTPVLIVSVGDDDEVVSDTLIKPEDFEAFLEDLLTGGIVPRQEPEDQ